MDFWISRSLFTVGKGARGAVPNSACVVSHPRTSGLARAVTFKLYGHFGVWSRILTCSASALEASDAWRGSLETQGGPCVTGNLPKRQDSRSCRRDEEAAPRAPAISFLARGRQVGLGQRLVGPGPCHDHAHADADMVVCSWWSLVKLLLPLARQLASEWR
jgi:hypothetical protein